MKLYQRFGITFSLFSLVTLVWNLFTPDNPDHLGNLLLAGGLCLPLAISYFLPHLVAKTLQVVAFACVAFFPTYFTGEPFFGAVSAVIGLALTYAYGGYRTHRAWKLPVTMSIVFIIFALATPIINLESTLRAFVWTVYVGLACAVLWMILEDVDARFHRLFASELIKQNRELLDINKKLAGGCNDGTERR
jgi:hypothetical protein